MLNIGVHDKVETVWCFDVPMVAGRRKWPEGLHAKALEKISAGHSVCEVAEEIGANKSRVAHWATRGKSGMPETVGSVEALPPSSTASKLQPRGKPTASIDAMSCRIRIGDAEIAVGPGYPVDHLTEVLRAVRAAL